MWQILQQEKPDDFILATGENHSIREFVDLAFKELDISIDWVGDGINEKGINVRNGKTIIAIDKKYYRPTEVDQLLGDPSKANKKLGWSSNTSFKDLVKIMVMSDLEKVKKRGY